MTTNGRLPASKVRGRVSRRRDCRRVTVSLDTLDDAVFRSMNGRGLSGWTASLTRHRRSDRRRAGLTPIKINSVVQRGVNDHTVVDLARQVSGEPGVIVRFIEFMDVGTLNDWRMDCGGSIGRDRLAMIDAEMPHSSRSSADVPGRGGEPLPVCGRIGRDRLSFPLSRKPFCGDCTRLRLSPEGEIYTCLFGSDRHTDLKTPDARRGGR